MSTPPRTSADQAHESLTAADERDCWTSPYGEGPNYSDGFRALRDAQVGTGCAVLAVSEELAKLREDLTDTSNALADIRSEVADVAAAVRELADAIRTQQPRRRRFSRLVGGGV